MASAVRAVCGLAAASMTLVGCGSPPVTLDSPDPAARQEAIRRAAATKDQTAIPGLINQLQSDDPAVRLTAIRALERITGTTNGYAHFDPEWRRREAVRTWVQWWQDRQSDAATDAGRAERPGPDAAAGGQATATTLP